jgi:DNA polymerase-1
MIRIAMVNIRKKAKEFPAYDIKFHATVHDEVVASCREEYVTEASELIKSTMQSAVRFCVPVVSDIGTGKSYSDAK